MASKSQEGLLKTSPTTRRRPVRSTTGWVGKKRRTSNGAIPAPMRTTNTEAAGTATWDMLTDHGAGAHARLEETANWEAEEDDDCDGERGAAWGGRPRGGRGRQGGGENDHPRHNQGRRHRDWDDDCEGRGREFARGHGERRSNDKGYRREHTRSPRHRNRVDGSRSGRGRRRPADDLTKLPLMTRNTNHEKEKQPLRLSAALDKVLHRATDEGNEAWFAERA